MGDSSAAAAASSGSEPDDHPWTIDEIARRSGMTARNIRAHQSRGLLPAPQVRGRTGYYGPDHLARLALIRQLQADGFNLTAIARIVAVAPAADEPSLRFLRAAYEPYHRGEPEVVSADALAAEWGAGGGALVERAIELGLLRRRSDGDYEYPRPDLIRAARELAALGVDPAAQLEVAATVGEHMQAVAAAYVDLFVRTVWQPFADAGAPAERWPELLDALARLRTLSTEGASAALATAMEAQTDAAFGRELERIARTRAAGGDETGGRA